MGLNLSYYTLLKLRKYYSGGNELFLRIRFSYKAFLECKIWSRHSFHEAVFFAGDNPSRRHFSLI